MIDENKVEIIEMAEDYLVLYKPPLMHTVPLKAGEGGTLLEWAGGKLPDILRVKGRKKVECGVLHRLDYGTSGLVLAARTDKFYQNLLEQQEKSLFLKEYRALCSKKPLNYQNFRGFPPPPASADAFLEGLSDGISQGTGEFLIQSGFRAFGPGRKSVRPLVQGAVNTVYTTKILSAERSRQGDGGIPDNNYCFKIELARGFRHQIRCHLAWLGFPIINDTLYGGEPCAKSGAGHWTPAGAGHFALKAVKLQFKDPKTGKGLVFEL